MRSQRANIVCLRTSNMRPIGRGFSQENVGRRYLLRRGPESTTLQTSMWPAGRMYQSSRRLRRDSTYLVNSGVSVRSTSRAVRSASGRSAAMRGAGDRRALLGLLVEAQRAGAARQRRQQLHAAQHAAGNHDVAVELARRLADDHVELGAAAGVGPVARGRRRACRSNASSTPVRKACVRCRRENRRASRSRPRSHPRRVV